MANYVDFGLGELVVEEDETPALMSWLGAEERTAVSCAAALDLGDDLDGIVTYDPRLADAARAQGVPVIAPS